MSITLNGEWDKARKILANMDARYEKAVKKALSRCGIYLVGQIKRGIRNQKPGGKQYEPLHPFTIARKGSSKAMIDDGDFLNAVTYRVTGNQVFVGVLKTAKDSDGKPLVNIAAVHEFGAEINVTDKMRGYLHSIGLHLKPTTTVIKIPARPTFGPVYKMEKDELVKMIEKELQKELFGN